MILLIDVKIMDLLVPVGERHHDVKRSESEHEVEEGPRIRYSVFFVVPDFSSWFYFMDVARFWSWNESVVNNFRVRFLF